MALVISVYSKEHDFTFPEAYVKVMGVTEYVAEDPGSILAHMRIFTSKAARESAAEKGIIQDFQVGIPERPQTESGALDVEAIYNMMKSTKDFENAVDDKDFESAKEAQEPDAPIGDSEE